MNDFDPLADARKAASLIVLRDREAGDGFEVLMMRRAERDGDFRSGAAVFPGGAVDAADAQAHGHALGWTDAQASARMGLPGGGLDYLVAAARECFEEAGLLYATPLDEPRLATAHAQWRAPMQQGQRTVSDLCAHLDMRIDLRDWHCWSHWLTPPGHPKRFDTRFFVARAPAAQQAEADFGEALELLWLTPAQALDRAFGLKLLPVTRRTLQQLGAFGSVQAVLDHAATLTAYPMTMPRRALSAAGELRIVLPDEAPYAEVARLDPTGQWGALGEIVPGRAIRLSENVIRVTAPNPGVMTGPGTNTYLVGDAARGAWTVIDPGPADPVHLRVLLAAAPGPIERILVTHTHKDHSPGAAELARATGAPVLGRRALHPQGQDESFEPQREVADGEVFPVGEGLALQAFHTPGHASNHLCFLLPHERMLFTGDHVMQGSTVVINPPDGDMAAYLDALRGLLELPVEWLAPGHGFLVAQPRAVIEALIRHRLARESRVLEAMGALAPAPLEVLLPRVYADVPPALHPMARRSLLAHLLKLQGDGIAALEDGAWGFVQPGQGVQRPSTSSS